jgi:AraC-like DNA-binding protein
LYVVGVTGPPGSYLTAWRPAVPGIAEVFHARFVDYAYPSHTHDAWTLIILDEGAIRFDLDRHRHGAAGATVTLLPPQVPHDGRAATPHGFRKRVLYLDASVLGDELVGAAVDRPGFRDALLRRRIHQLHLVLADPADALEAESRLALVCERLRGHLREQPPTPTPTPAAGRLARELRDLLDAHINDGLTLREAADLLHAHPTHLVRAFTKTHGLPPHRYLTGRRIEAARRLLLAGRRPADVAVELGFHDQAHLTRHFLRYVGTTPARFAAGH